MRIISKFKDYYDGYQTFDKNDYLYIRETKDWTTYDYDAKFPSFSYPSWLTGASYTIKLGDKFYSTWRVPVESKSGVRDWSNPIVCFSPNEVIEVSLAHSNKETQKHIQRWQEYRYKIQSDFSDEFHKNWIQRLEQQKDIFYPECPIVIWHYYQTAKITILNGKLHGTGFEKIKHAWDVYQELDMWFGNQAQPDPGKLTIDDESMLIKKGFNKWSFKYPSGYKPNRKAS